MSDGYGEANRNKVEAYSIDRLRTTVRSRPKLPDSFTLTKRLMQEAPVTNEGSMAGYLNARESN